MLWPLSDRRSSQRIPVSLRAQYRSSSTVLDGVVEDLSRGGMFIATDSLDVLGADAAIDLELPGDGKVQLRGEVVRIEHDRRKGLGIRIARDDEARRPLANFMMKSAFLNRDPH
jgi:Tfp pilus assembly protein PilZ